jgi:GNAT superfamily N-acetyltransferase
VALFHRLTPQAFGHSLTLAMPVRPATGGTLLQRAIRFVVACRRQDPSGDCPHPGDLCWWFRDPAFDDDSGWRFWQDGETTRAMCLTGFGAVDYVVAPGERTPELVSSIRSWARMRLMKRAGGKKHTVIEEATDTDPDKVALFEQEGYRRKEWHYVRFSRLLSGPLPEPSLPNGFVLRGLSGEGECESIARLHHKAFEPHSRMTTERYLRVMRTPCYDPELNVVAIAPGGEMAAHCICWYDPMNRTGLFEPLGTHPRYRRKGLATAVMLQGLHRLKKLGARRAFVTAQQPNDPEDAPPSPFTSSRFVYPRVGFEPWRRTFVYARETEPWTEA